MTLKRNDNLSIVKTSIAFFGLVGTIIIYNLIVFIYLSIKSSSQIGDINHSIEETKIKTNSLIAENLELKKKNDYIVQNSINLEELRNSINKIATALENNIVVDRTNSKLFEIKINKIERVKEVNGKEYLNYVDVIIDVNNVHRFNTDELAMLRFKKIIEIPAIKKVLNPIAINGQEYFYKGNSVAFRIFKPLNQNQI